MSPRVVRFLALALVFAGAIALDPTGDGVPHLTTADAQLAHARRVRSAVRAGQGPERDRAIEEALEAYGAISRFFPEDAARCAEAHFRRGEILRAASRGDEALAAFEGAVLRGARTPFRARARLEIGHVHRRAGRLESALDVYTALLLDDGAERGQRDLAALWAGRIQAGVGRFPEARRIWTLLADRAERPVVRVRAFDLLALSRCESGDVSAARELLARCRSELSEIARELTHLGRSVRRALSRMRVVRCLAQGSESADR